MNQVHLIGRFVKDVQVTYNNHQIPYVNFTLAIQRDYKDKNGNRQADFIPCQAFRQTAELIAQYAEKGKQVAVDGKIQTELYQTKDGKRKQSIRLIVNRLYFIEGKKELNRQTEQANRDESFIFFPQENDFSFYPEENSDD